MTSRFVGLAALVTVAFAGGPATAEDAPIAIPLTITDHRFSPAEIHLPAGKPAILQVVNQDATVEEVESTSLNIEKVIPGGATSKVRLRALEPGRYPFMGEYHSDTAQGFVVAE